MNRIILHSDLNNFFASCECVSNSEYKDKYLAVCGSKNDRHGIVLAKNQKAKELGVQTGEPIFRALQKCPKLTVVEPNFEKYTAYSKAVREIYSEYTDLVEDFGLDECWLDVSHSTLLFGDGKNIAETLRSRIKKETGLTVSIGVSFNKVFSKLGSDLKKPDAVTEITFDNFKEKIWALPARDLLGVGRNTDKVLKSHGIFTIGQIANSPVKYLEKWLGKCGEMLYLYANGLESSPVTPINFENRPQSISHGVTLREDVENVNEASKVLLYLSNDISAKLRREKLLCTLVTVTVKDNSLYLRDYSFKLSHPSRSADTIHKSAVKAFAQGYEFNKNVRALTVRVSALCDENESFPLDFFCDPTREEKIERKESTVDQIRKIFGKNALVPASLLGDFKMPLRENMSRLPGNHTTRKQINP